MLLLPKATGRVLGLHRRHGATCLTGTRTGQSTFTTATQCPVAAATQRRAGLGQREERSSNGLCAVHAALPPSWDPHKICEAELSSLSEGGRTSGARVCRREFGPPLPQETYGARAGASHTG